MPAFDDHLRSRVAGHLERFECREILAEGRKSAAVAVVVVPDEDDQAAVILTVRAAGLRRHGGQWAFPGGRRDPGESPEDTALRELAEEVGLVIAPGDVLGRLDDFATRSGFVITPVVVWGPEEPCLEPDPNEVASAHFALLDDVARPENLVIEGVSGSVSLGGSKGGSKGGTDSDRPLLALELLGTTIFSPTAAILHQFSEVAVAGRDTRVAHYEQPRFAWR